MRGLNSPLRKREVKNFIQQKQISLIGLVEVKVREKNFIRISKNTLTNWEIVHNTLLNSVARIWEAWNPSTYTGRVLHASAQSKTCRLTYNSSISENFIITVVYGYNEKSNRRNLWQELRYQYQLYGAQLWLLMRDFNIILDKKGNLVKKELTEMPSKNLHSRSRIYTS